MEKLFLLFQLALAAILNICIYTLIIGQWLKFGWSNYFIGYFVMAAFCGLLLRLAVREYRKEREL